jgi:hypothetical protein
VGYWIDHREEPGIYDQFTNRQPARPDAIVVERVKARATARSKRSAGQGARLGEKSRASDETVASYLG